MENLEFTQGGRLQGKLGSPEVRNLVVDLFVQYRGELQVNLWEYIRDYVGIVVVRQRVRGYLPLQSYRGYRLKVAYL